METQKTVLEFEDRNVVEDLANKMTVSSWMFYFLAAVKGLSAIKSLSRSGEGHWDALVLAVLFFAFGLFTSQAATAFKIVVNSSSNQLSLLVDALRCLRRQYTMIYWFILVAVLANVLLLAAAPLLVLIG